MILLNRQYDAYLTGTIVQLSTQLEASLVGQGLASVSAGPVTAGAVNAGVQGAGRAGIAAAGASVVITSALCTTESKINAYLSNAGADASATFVTRIVPAAGSFTIFLNAAATGIVALDWNYSGSPGFSIRN